MKKAVFLIALGFYALMATAQQETQTITGNDKKLEKTHTVASFSEIAVHGPFNVILKESNTVGSITLKGAENIVNLITVTTNNGVLSIKLPKHITLKGHKNNAVKIIVPYTTLNKISLDGSGKITSRNTFTNDVITYINGAGIIDIRVWANTTNAIVLGSGSIMLNGKVANLTCKVVGAGSVNAEMLQANTVEAIVCGTGNIVTDSHTSIIGRISGTGTLAFSGNPRVQDFKKIGSGEFKTF